MNETTDNLADNTTMSHLDVEKDRSQVSVLPIIPLVTSTFVGPSYLITPMYLCKSALFGVIRHKLYEWLVKLNPDAGIPDAPKCFQTLDLQQFLRKFYLRKHEWSFLWSGNLFVNIFFVLKKSSCHILFKPCCHLLSLM